MACAAGLAGRPWPATPRRRLRGPRPAPLQQPPLGQRREPAAGDDEMVERADVDQRQRLLQRLRQELVGAAGSATPDGWLWAKIIAAALRASAALTTSRG